MQVGNKPVVVRQCITTCSFLHFVCIDKLSQNVMTALIQNLWKLISQQSNIVLVAGAVKSPRAIRTELYIISIVEKSQNDFIYKLSLFRNHQLGSFNIKVSIYIHAYMSNFNILSNLAFSYAPLNLFYNLIYLAAPNSK